MREHRREESSTRRFSWESESLALLNHDLRNALGSMVSALEILELEGQTNTLAEQAQHTLERQTTHLRSIADRLSHLAGVPLPDEGMRARENRRSTRCTEQTFHCRILVVDDNRDAADSVGTLLVLLGHEVRIAYTGSSALMQATEQAPDVCLIDLGMPVMDGFELARRLRQVPKLKNTLLVALTGYDEDSDRQLSVQAGFDSFLVKPVACEALMDVLEQGHSRASTLP